MKKAIITRIRAEVSRLAVLGTIGNGDQRHAVTTTPRDGKRAVRGNACHCTMANAATRELRIPCAIFERTVAYLLEPTGDGRFQVRKYEHDGAAIADALDKEGLGIPRATVTLRPPSKYRRVGAQTAAQKARRDRKRKPAQTSAHVDKRSAGIRAATAERAQRRKIAV